MNTFPNVRLLLDWQSTPLARILEGVIFVYFIPVLADFFVLEKLLKVQKKTKLMISALLANLAVGIGIFLSQSFFGDNIVGLWHLPIIVLCLKVLIKVPVYLKMLSGKEFKNMVLCVLASTVAGCLAQNIAAFIWGWAYFSWFSGA